VRVVHSTICTYRCFAAFFLILLSAYLFEEQLLLKTSFTLIMLSSILHPTRRRAVLLFPNDVTVFFNIATDNFEEERTDWKITRFIATAVCCREVPNLDDDIWKELNVNFHHEGYLIENMNIRVPMSWTANLFLTFLAFTSYDNNGTITCVSDVTEEEGVKKNDICEIVETWKTKPFYVLENIGMESEHNGVISGGEYCGC
jgi:hypothetical protein